jgi:hypothetical protein
MSAHVFEELFWLLTPTLSICTISPHPKERGMFGLKNLGLLYGAISWKRKSLAKDTINCEESSRYITRTTMLERLYAKPEIGSLAWIW